ncbi:MULTISPECIES: cysteine synthase A [Clostridium]|uniref:Cysteine synthase n=3 Tax=Clostridium TaxID=1485 RepID=D8GLD6_CLOLD|nr:MULTISPECIES: cysteine synthase A [Clostridium]ADK15495.1 cysteine synthase [Clostridium ljungdahlii DSM 13528]AGY74726.1 cysteine synthase A [Clostridium autoethanogenum DSM 10061]ALU34905.1 Cysteine synthase A [Clostridium autoethanogenum DSM 10061]OAA85505.1 O-acetylserine dependent cystathionine beta-synthase [Clostridium ljungdahlii DSM 13528]OVY51705.1 O-acetylserine dependent cystathionine beta-synthase [Clostridium autoethanogenum]
MEVFDDIKEMIGKTPILKINEFDLKDGVNIYAKLENFNPGGSVKDRIGDYMIKQAEKRGKLKKGYTIVEATAGNTGLGIALGALNRGYRVVFAVPEKFSIEKQVLMRALGAEIVHTPEKDGMRGAIEKSKELLSKIPNSISLSQFENEDNPQTHYLTTGPEIYEQLNGKIDYFVAGAGSGGTFTGIARYLKEKDNNVKAVLADPEGSTLGGGTEEHGYAIEGIGNDFLPDTMDLKLVDKVIKVNDEEAFSLVKELAKREGLIVGSSSGAAIAAALKLAKTIDKGNIVTVFPDRGDRYFSKNLYE